MIKFKHIMLFLGIVVTLNACVEPIDPTEVQILEGEWVVEAVAANGEINDPSGIFLKDAILHLDRNESFLFIDVDDRADAGTWTATESNLTLTLDNGSTIDFEIVYLDYDKLHANYSFTNALTGEIELRYLFRRADQGNVNW